MSKELKWNRGDTGFYFSGPYTIARASNGWLVTFNRTDFAWLPAIKLAKYVANVDANNRLA